MNRIAACLPIVALLAGSAHAESPSLVARAAEPQPQYAIAVNSPLGWFPQMSADGHTPSIGISGYAGITDQFVLRGNIAYGANDTRLAFQSECPVYGEHTDVSATAQFYPFGRFDGFFLEAGPMLRSNPDREFECEYSGNGVTKTDTMMLGGVAMIGYTYTGGHFFFSTAIGASYLHESGRESVAPVDSIDGMTVTSDVSRAKAGPEWMMRFGAAF